MRITGLLLLLGIGVASPATAQEAAAADGPRWYAVPNIAYDADDGLGFGVRGELAVDAPGYTPYRTAYVLHLFASLRGYHHHRFRFDRTGLGPGGALRLTAHVAWRMWLNDGYWGIGNGTARERAYVSPAGDDPSGGKRYRYTLFQPFTHLTLRARVAPRWSLFTAINAKWSEVETYAGSLLSEQRPFGMGGGLGLVLSAGLLYDSRRPEVDPRSGMLVELSGRGALPLPGNAGSCGGPFASWRGFWSPAPWLVLAGRVMAEALVGEVPFYEMVHWGGFYPVAGFGGFETLRGVSFGRWRAPGKVLANLEGRFYLAEHALLGQPMRWQVALFTDVGAVFGARDQATAPAPAWPLHPPVGGGLRVVYAGSFVGRIDAGLAPDPIRELDGRITQALSWGLYVVFDQAF